MELLLANWNSLVGEPAGSWTAGCLVRTPGPADSLAQVASGRQTRRGARGQAKRAGVGAMGRYWTLGDGAWLRM